MITEELGIDNDDVVVSGIVFLSLSDKLICIFQLLTKIPNERGRCSGGGVVVFHSIITNQGRINDDVVDSSAVASSFL